MLACQHNELLHFNISVGTIQLLKSENFIEIYFAKHACLFIFIFDTCENQICGSTVIIILSTKNIVGYIVLNSWFAYATGSREIILLFAKLRHFYWTHAADKRAEIYSRTESTARKHYYFILPVRYIIILFRSNLHNILCTQYYIFSDR